MKLLTLVLLAGMMIGCAKETVKTYVGKDGSSCSVEPFSNGAIISCTDGTSHAILNGTDGVDGVSGVIEVIDVCPENGKFTEVILRLHTGELLAHYSHGNKQFLTIIGDGNYVTTDGYSCNFSVVNGEVIR